MENKPTQANFPLRPGEHVVFVTRWDGGWVNSLLSYGLLGIASIAGLIVGDLLAMIGMFLGVVAFLKLILEFISRMNGRAVLTDQRIVVKSLPSPFFNKEVELTDVQGLDAGTDLVRAGAGMSSMTVILNSGERKGLVIPNASKFVEAYKSRFPG